MRCASWSLPASPIPDASRGQLCATEDRPGSSACRPTGPRRRRTRRCRGRRVRPSQRRRRGRRGHHVQQWMSYRRSRPGEAVRATCRSGPRPGQLAPHFGRGCEPAEEVISPTSARAAPVSADAWSSASLSSSSSAGGGRRCARWCKIIWSCGRCGRRRPPGAGNLYPADAALSLPARWPGRSVTSGSTPRIARRCPARSTSIHVPPAQRPRYRRPNNTDRQNPRVRVRPSHSRSERRRTGLWMHSPSSPGSRQSPGQSPRQCLQWRTGGMLTPGVDVARGSCRRPRWSHFMMHAALPRGCPRGDMTTTYNRRWQGQLTAGGVLARAQHTPRSPLIMPAPPGRSPRDQACYAAGITPATP